MDDTLRSCREFTEVLASDAPTPGGGGAAADGFGRAQTDVPAGAGYGIGRGSLLARQHTLAAFLTFPVGFVHGAAPPFV